MWIQNNIKNRRVVNGALANHICKDQDDSNFFPHHFWLHRLRLYFDIQLDSAKSCTEGEELTKHSSFSPNIEIGFSFIHRYPFLDLIHTTLTLPKSVVILTGFLIALSIKIPVDHLWEKQTFHRTEMK